MHLVRQISLIETVNDLLQYKLEVKSVRKRVKEGKIAMREELHRILMALVLPMQIEIRLMDQEMQVMILESLVNHYINVILTL